MTWDFFCRADKDVAPPSTSFLFLKKALNSHDSEGTKVVVYILNKTLIFILQNINVCYVHVQPGEMPGSVFGQES